MHESFLYSRTKSASAWDDSWKTPGVRSVVTIPIGQKVEQMIKIRNNLVILLARIPHDTFSVLVMVEGGAKGDVTVNIKGGATNTSDEKFQIHFHSLKP